MSSLERGYTAVLGTKPAKGSLYGGFYLLLGGVVLAIAAVVLLAVAYGRPSAGSEFRWREGAFVLALLAGPLILLGIHMALPTGRAMRITAFVGVAVCVVATFLFSVHYPFHFNVPDAAAGQADYTAIDISVYAIGAALLLAGTFTSLIGYYVSRAQGVAAASQPAGRSDPTDQNYWGEEVPDSVVEKDIDYAMKHYGVSWGDTSKTIDRSIQVNMKDDFGPGFQISGKGVARTVEITSPQVDDATTALRNVRPKHRKAEVGSEQVDDSTDALKAFRAKQRADPKAFAAEAKAASGKRPGFWARLFGRKTAVPDDSGKN